MNLEAAERAGARRDDGWLDDRFDLGGVVNLDEARDRAPIVPALEL